MLGKSPAVAVPAIIGDIDKYIGPVHGGLADLIRKDRFVAYEDTQFCIAGLKRRTGSPGSEISYLLGEPRRKGKQTPERNVLAKRDKVNFVIARNEFSLWAKQ